MSSGVPFSNSRAFTNHSYFRPVAFMSSMVTLGSWPQLIRFIGRLGDWELFPAFPGAVLRDAVRVKFGLKVGVERGSEGHKFNALVDLLVSRGYL